MLIDVPGEGRIWMALLFGVLWSPFVGLGLWMIAMSYRASITLEDGGVSVTKLFRNRQFAFAKIATARWSPYGHSLKLVSAQERCRIDFRDFRTRDGLELIRVLRERIPPEAQQGWNEMWQQSANVPPHDMTLAEFNALHAKLSRMVIPFGPLFGFTCGGYLRMHGGPDAGTIAWLLLKWGSYGLAISLGVSALLWGMSWISRADVADP